MVRRRQTGRGGKCPGRGRYLPDMCGIAVILKFTPKGVRQNQEVIAESWMDALDAAIAHRGPNGRGRYRDAVAAADGSGTVHVAMAHRRLAVIDPAGGRQPMVRALAEARAPELAHAALQSGDDGVYHGLEHGAQHHESIVFNGCIYNHRELRAAMAASGRAFVTDHSDTEAMLHACGHWQTGQDRAGSTGTVIDQLDGMFAFAFWSSRLGTLKLGRDLAGEKPLYWMRPDRNTFVACSSAAGVLKAAKLMGHVPRVDVAGVTMWLKHGYWPVMPVEGLFEAEPGTLLRVVAGGETGMAVVQVAKLRIPGRGGGEAGGGARLEPEGVMGMLRHAVGTRLEADVPIGCFLSGGVDSSLIAALGQDAMKASGRTLMTFTVAMPDAALDESGFAEKVAAHLGTRHLTLNCAGGGQTAAGDIERLIGQLGLPFGDSSLLPTHWLAAAAREHVTVALGGDGGDELFGGYKRYTAARLMQSRAGLLAAAGLVPSGLFGLASKGLQRVLTASRNFGYQDILTIHTTPQLERVLAGGERVGELRRMLAEQYGRRTVFADARQDDFDNYLPQDLMRKVDTATMAVALEVRSPLLERDVVFAALRATLAEVEAGQGRKGLLREVARKLIPAEMVDRPKQGFAIPIGRWITENFGGLRDLAEAAFGPSGHGPDLFGAVVDRVAARAMLDEHTAGKGDYGQRLYSLMVLWVWCRWLEGA